MHSTHNNWGGIMVLALWAVWRYFTPCIAPPSRTTWHLTFCNQSTTVILNFWSCLRRMTFCPFVPAQRGLGDYLHARHGLQDSCVVKSCHRDDERLFWLTRISIHGTRYWQEGRNVLFFYAQPTRTVISGRNAFYYYTIHATVKKTYMVS